MSINAPNLTYKELRELIDYNPESGLTIWKKDNHRVKAGEALGSTVSAIANGKQYARVKIKQKTYKLHRIIWFYMTKKWPINCIDHIDGNSLNNKWSNLRQATIAENAKNIKGAVKSKTGVRGLSKHGFRYWYAHITSDGVTHRKLFKQTEEGKQSAIDWLATTRKQLHKDFSSI